MSQYIHWEEGEPEELSSLSGWGDVMDWVELLPNLEADFPQLVKLVDEENCREPVLLSQELERAVVAVPPGSDVSGILTTLQESLRANTHLNSFVVNQGFVTGLFVKWESTKPDEEGHLFCSINGWRAFIRWFNNLPNRTEFPQLGQLVEVNRSDDPASLETEIKRAQALLDSQSDLYFMLDALKYIIKARGENKIATLSWDEDEEEE